MTPMQIAADMGVGMGEQIPALGEKYEEADD